MTQQQQQQVKALLAQGSNSSTSGDFSMSLSGGMLFDIPMYAITIYMNDHTHMISCYDIERINDVCRVMEVFYTIRIENNVPVIKIG